MSEKNCIDVAAGIVWRNARFLAAKRPEGKDRAGFWEFPGGKREAGESMDQTLRRELREELGIECRTVLPWLDICHDYPDITVHLYFLHVTDFTGEPAPHDGQSLRWVTPEEARSMNFLPADKEILEKLRPPRA